MGIEKKPNDSDEYHEDATTPDPDDNFVGKSKNDFKDNQERLKGRSLQRKTGNGNPKI